jgi:hypothetical protein
VAGSLAAGYLLAGSRSSASAKNRSLPAGGVASVSPPLEASAAEPQGNGVSPSSRLDKFAPELEKLKGIAIGVLLGLARDWIKESAPPALASELGQLLDDVTAKLGGKPLAGPLLAHPIDQSGEKPVEPDQ